MLARTCRYRACDFSGFLPEIPILRHMSQAILIWLSSYLASRFSLEIILDQYKEICATPKTGFELFWDPDVYNMLMYSLWSVRQGHLRVFWIDLWSRVWDVLLHTEWFCALSVRPQKLGWNNFMFTFWVLAMKLVQTWWRSLRLPPPYLQQKFPSCIVVEKASRGRFQGHCFPLK